ncbi:hypothetical protein CR513_29514, partial [Mucuna pruriens]
MKRNELIQKKVGSTIQLALAHQITTNVLEGISLMTFWGKLKSIYMTKYLMRSKQCCCWLYY